MKKLLLLFLTISINYLAICQDSTRRFKLNAGIQLALPVYNMEINTFGSGLDIKGIYKLTSKVDVTLDAGFNIFFAKKEFVPTGLLPFRAGLSYWLKPNIFLLAKGGLGIYMLYTPGETVTKNFAGLELGTGFVLSRRLDLQFSYNAYQNKDGSFGFIGSRLGYSLLK